MDKASFKERWKNSVNRKKLLGFVDKYGFYVVLLLCLCIIGATAFLTFDRSPGEEPIDAGEEQSGTDIPAEGLPEGAPEEIDIVITDVDNKGHDHPQPDQTADPEGEPADVDANRPNEQKQPDTAEPEEDSNADQGANGADSGTNSDKEDAAISASASADGKAGSVEKPAVGEVIRAFALEELVYSPTLKEWTTHTGVDIGGPVGGEVRAALAGAVESIEEDSLRGIVITLSHENGLKTVYTGLSTKDMVKVGQAVEKGQVISGIGRTAAFEITDDPHVHFEVLLDGEYQDPSKYLES